MGDRRFGIVLLVAVLVAAAAGIGVFRTLQRAEAEARVPMARVLVARADFPEGHVLGPNDVRAIELPVAAVPAGSYAVLDSVVGRVTRIPVFTGEALIPGRLAPIGTGSGLEVKITPGKRAMAVKIDEVAGLAGLIQPNSRVDVLVTMRADGPGQEQRAKLIMSNMRVLSVGSQIERGPDGRPANATTAALEVTPAEAEQLAVAANQGKIQLALRGYGDPDTVATGGASARDVLGERAEAVVAAPVRAPAPAPRRVEPAPQPAPNPTPAPPPATRRPDSAVVQVFRGAAVTQQRVERRDSVRRDTIRPDTLRLEPAGQR
jgi:pilus assembly protein CpaB